MRKNPLQGTGQKWFPVPDFVVSTGNSPSPVTQLNAPALRLLLLLYAEAGRSGHTVIELANTDAQKRAALDRESLPAARRSLEGQKLIRAESINRQTWRYSLCDPMSTTQILPSSKGDEGDTWGS